VHSVPDRSHGAFEARYGAPQHAGLNVSPDRVRSKIKTDPFCPKTRAITSHCFAVVEQLTFSSSGQSANRTSITCEEPVWEVLTSLANRIARTLFVVEGRPMVVLHGFIKKTQQTPNDDIKLAEKRFKEWQRGEA
jgi:Phage derived protein Gp49-like (DUF891)